MFTDSAYNNADACRFCWMCRHLCPISNVTGKEINSARAKGLLVSLVKRGAEFDATMVWDQSSAVRGGIIDQTRWLYTAATRSKEKLIIVK